MAKATLDKNCPTRQLMDLMSDKWVPGLLYALSDGPQRPTDLSDRLDGISRKMLTQTLRKLEEWGLVNRKVFAVVPPKVEYSLTSMGRRLLPPLENLSKWAKDNAALVRKIHRRRNDE